MTKKRLLEGSVLAMCILVVVAHLVMAATQNAYRWRNDDGTQATATWSAAENTPLTNVAKNTAMRLRFGVANSGAESELLEKAAMALPYAENNAYAATIDTIGGYAYFGTSTTPGVIIKVRLSDFTRVGALVLATGEDFLTNAVMDATNGYAYFGTNTTPGKVVKIRLSDFTEVGTLTLNTGENSLNSAVIDTANGYAYFGTATSPAIVVKVALGVGAAAPTRIGAVTLNTGENIIFYNGVIDTANGYAYFGTFSNPAYVVKVSLGSGSNPPTRMGATALNTGEDHISSSAIDTASGVAYFGTYTTPATVVKVSLGSGSTPPSRLSAITLGAGETYASSASIDLSGGYVYFGCSPTPSPGKVAKIRLSDFTEVGSITLANGKNSPFSSVIDSSAGNLYFGLNQGGSSAAGVPTTIVKIRLSDFAEVGTLTSPNGVVHSNPVSAVIDSTNGYAYFGTMNAPGTVIKVRLSDYTEVGALTLNSGENFLYSAAIDTVNGFAYFGTGTSPGIVVKVALGSGDAPPTRVDAVTLPAGINNLYASAIDTIGGNVYFGAGTTPGNVVKIVLSAFPSYTVFPLTTGENNIRSAVIDPTNGYVYFGLGVTPGKVVKVQLSTFAELGSLTLNTGENGLTAATIDRTNGYAYFGTNTSPANVVKVALGSGASLPTRVGAVTLNTGENQPFSAAIDTANQYAYFGTNTSPGNVVKVALGSGSNAPTRVGSISLGTNENTARSSVIDTAKGYLYLGCQTTPGRLAKVSIAPHAQFRLEYGAKSSTCPVISSWSQIPVTATTEAWQMANSAFVADGAATTNVVSGLTDGNTVFTAGQFKSASSQTQEIATGERRFTELEYGIQATSYATDNATYCFRLTDAGTALANYSNYAEATLGTSASLPTANNFSSQSFGGIATTNFGGAGDLTSIASMSLAKTGYGSIQWISNVNASAQDLDSNIRIGTGFVSLNKTSLHSSFDTAAHVKIAVAGCTNPQIWYSSGYRISLAEVQATGQACNSGTTPSCTNITCSNNVLSFDVPHFDSYGGQGQPQSQGVTTTLGITNVEPTLSSASDNGSSAATPTNEGQNVTFTVSASDPNGDSMYIAICKVNSITPNANAAPTCNGAGAWYVDSSERLNPIVSASVTAPTTGLAGESYDWYAFACDKVASNPLCSPMLNTDSPFNVNHRPSYSGYVATDTSDGTIEPGDNVKFAVTTSDTDINTAPDTVALFVCASGNSFNGSACSGTELCHASLASPGALSCNTSSSPAPIPTAHGNYDVEVFVVDSHSFVGSVSSDQLYSVTDTPPFITSSNDYMVNDIALTAGNPTDKSYLATIKDNNGDTDLTGATATLYDDDAIDLSSGTCPADDRNCYPGIVCAPEAANGDNSLVYTCNPTVWFNADFSDSSGRDWRLHANPTDGASSPTNLTDSNAIQVNPVQAINVLTPSDTIAYGSVALGAVSNGKAVTIENEGNQILDVLVQGTDMTRSGGGATIPYSQQKWNNTVPDFDYGTAGNPLVSNAAGATIKALGCADRDIAVRGANHSSGLGSDENMYWKLQIPANQTAGSYSGTNTFIAAASTQCTDGE